MYQAIYNFEIGELVKFNNDSDVFKIVEYVSEDLENIRSIQVKLKNISKEEDFSYCHPTYPARKV